MSDFWLAPWYRWDAGNYLKIATEGYGTNDGTTSFAPLYPLLIRLMTPLALGNATLAALAISTITCAASLFLLLRYLTPDIGGGAARWAAVAWLVFPTGYYLLGPFTEGLCLSLVLGAMWMARKRRWWLAIVVAFLAGLARFHGVAVALPLAVEGWRQWRLGQPSKRKILASLLAVASAPISAAGYLLWAQQYAVGGQAEQYSAYANLVFVPPWVTLWRALQTAWTGYPIVQEILNPIVLVLTVVAVLLAWRRLPSQYLAYAAGFWFITLVTLVTVAPLRSYLRYGLLLFPAFAVVGLIYQRHPRLGFALVLFSAVFQLGFLWFHSVWGWVA